MSWQLSLRLARPHACAAQGGPKPRGTGATLAPTAVAENRMAPTPRKSRAHSARRCAKQATGRHDAVALYYEDAVAGAAQQAGAVRVDGRLGKTLGELRANLRVLKL